MAKGKKVDKAPAGSETKTGGTGDAADPAQEEELLSLGPSDIFEPTPAAGAAPADTNSSSGPASESLNDYVVSPAAAAALAGASQGQQFSAPQTVAALRELCASVPPDVLEDMYNVVCGAQQQRTLDYMQQKHDALMRVKQLGVALSAAQEAELEQLSQQLCAGWEEQQEQPVLQEQAEQRTYAGVTKSGQKKTGPATGGVAKPGNKGQTWRRGDPGDSSSAAAGHGGQATGNPNGIGKAERQRRMSEGLCLHCGRPGHQKRECPSWKGKEPAAKK